MPICQYFQRGNCRYGDKCWNEHPRGGAQRSLTFSDTQGQGGFNQYKWVNPSPYQKNTPNTAAAAATVSSLDLVNNLPKEVKTWQDSGMWPFSCIALERLTPGLPQFEDTSAEELRLEAYQMQKAGTFQQYIQKIQHLFNDFKVKKQLLINQTPELKQKLIQIVEENRQNSKNESMSGNQNSIFGGANQLGGNSPAGGFQTQGNKSVFGSSAFAMPSQGQSSIFGGGSGSTGPFGGGSTVTHTGNTTAGSNLFSSPSGGGNTFGFSTAATGTFGGSATGGGGSIFGGSGAAGVGSGFGGSPATGGNVFGGMASAVSGTPSGNSTISRGGNIFGGGGGTTFGGNSNLFGTASFSPGGQSQASSSTPGSVFGGGTSAFSQTPVSASATAENSAASSQASSMTNSVYTPLDKLTAQERAQFEAKIFTLGQIPMRPPPKELINV